MGGRTGPGLRAGRFGASAAICGATRSASTDTLCPRAQVGLVRLQTLRRSCGLVGAGAIPLCRSNPFPYQ